MIKSIIKLVCLVSMTWLCITTMASPYISPVLSMDIPAREVTITFDGLDNEASWSDAQTLTMFNTTGWDGSNEDFSGYFKVCWDMHYLYFFADITDDMEHCVPPYGDSWMFDNIEIYVNLDTSDNGEYYPGWAQYDQNTMQIRINRGIDSVLWTGRVAASEYYYYWHNKEPGNGWVVETGIPWTAILPEGAVQDDIIQYIHKVMGFDVIFSDSDIASGNVSIGARDIQAAWDRDDPNSIYGLTEDNAWNNVLVFGIMNLVGTPATPPPPPPPPYQPPYYKPVNTTFIPSKIEPAVIDGIDNEASYRDPLFPTIFSYESYTGSEDLSGYCQTYWDSTYLYLFASVVDDIEHSWTGTGNPREFDNIEFFIDLDTSNITAEYDENAIQLLFCRSLDTLFNTGRASKSDFLYYSCNTSFGWRMEVAIPWIAAMPEGSSAADIVPYLNNKMGFDFTFNDSDGTDPDDGNIDACAAWDMDNGRESDVWDSTYALGIADLIVVDPNNPSPYIGPVRMMDIPARIDDIFFDGLANEPSWSNPQDLFMFDPTGWDGTDADFSGYFKVTWDIGYLYFFADITDDINHSTAPDANTWMFDNIEIYVNLDTSDNFESQYDDNTMQIRINRGIDSVLWPGRASVSDYLFFWQNKESADGWVVEAGIPWTFVMPSGYEPEDIVYYMNNTMGFDVAFSDSDDPSGNPNWGARDIMMAWDSDDPDAPEDRTEDNAWNNVNVFGLVNLTGDPMAPPPKENTGVTDIFSPENIVLYPNPSDNYIHLSGIEGCRIIEIISINGQVVCRSENSRADVDINIDDLQSGVYMIRIVLPDNSFKTIPLVIE